MESKMIETTSFSPVCCSFDGSYVLRASWRMGMRKIKNNKNGIINTIKIKEQKAAHRFPKKQRRQAKERLISHA
jgi:hypothetical protein